MTGELQKNYLHGVPADKKQTGSHTTRIAIVFRQGLEKMVKKDSGVPASLEPRDVRIIYHHGCDIKGLEEGKLYSRTELINLKAHRCVYQNVPFRCRHCRDGVLSPYNYRLPTFKSFPEGCQRELQTRMRCNHCVRWTRGRKGRGYI